MNCMSWNVWGPIDLHRKYYVHDTKCQFDLDVLSLHEVKFFGFLLTLASRVIWPDSVVFASQHESG